MRSPNDEEIAEMHRDCGGQPPPEWLDTPVKDTSEYGKGDVYLFLDFTERRVVRE